MIYLDKVPLREKSLLLGGGTCPWHGEHIVGAILKIEWKLSKRKNQTVLIHIYKSTHMCMCACVCVSVFLCVWEGIRRKIKDLAGQKGAEQ